MFHPKILSSQKKTNPSLIFQELYECKDRKDLIIKNLIEKENFLNAQNSYKPLEISKKIVMIKRKFMLEELFILFDSDQDGKISSQKIDISKVPSKKLIILAPFLYYIEKNGLILKYDEFMEEIEKFINGLSYQEIHGLFD